jgi:hypothetical protein
VEVTDDPLSVSRGSSEVNREHSSARFEHTVNLACALLARRPRKMVQHEGAEDSVELTVGERKLLDDRGAEGDIGARFLRLTSGAGDHLGRCVDTVNVAGRADAALRRDRECSSSASDVEHRLAGFEGRELDQAVAEGALAATREQPDHEVVEAGGGAHHSTLRHRRCQVPHRFPVH